MIPAALQVQGSTYPLSATVEKGSSVPQMPYPQATQQKLGMGTCARAIRHYSRKKPTKWGWQDRKVQVGKTTSPEILLNPWVRLFIELRVDGLSVGYGQFCEWGVPLGGGNNCREGRTCVSLQRESSAEILSHHFAAI